MQYAIATIAILAMLVGIGDPARLETREFSELESSTQTSRQLRWPKRTIEVAFSVSLNTPGPNIKPGSDVIGAARRALSRWSTMANINFAVTWSSATSVSPASGGDGISLFTLADTLENEAFNAYSTTGRTRVFYDPETGTIAEADICINPRPRSQEGAETQFSTDGSPGTYDLEATFTHEIGHLLGLDHSAILASTMQSRQAYNGTFGLPALTERTLSEDDRQRIRSIYGPKQRFGKIEGRLIDNRDAGTPTPLDAVNVWAENVSTGRVVASDITAEDGSYRLDGLIAGQYRVLAASGAEEVVLPADDTSLASVVVGSARKFRSFELSNQVVVKSDAAATLNYSLVPPNASPPSLNPRVIGLNGELSTVPLPLEPGKRVKIYLGGEGIDQVPGTSITVNSPFFVVDPSSLAREQLSTRFPVISVELSVAANVPFGDYTIRLQSNSGENAYVPGAVTIDPGVSSPMPNPVDDSKFFIAQHYEDLIGQEAEQSAIDKHNAQFLQCGARSDCLRARRIDISTALLVENELPTVGSFVHGLYTVGLGRQPRFSEFESDREAVMKPGVDIDGRRLALALAFVQRPEFERRYPVTMKAGEFVDAVLLSINQNTGISLASERSALIDLFDAGTNGRAAVLTRAIALPAVVDAQYNEAFVLTQYFSYLRRDPEKSGYNLWLNILKSKPVRDPSAARSMVCTFLNSTEYQARFGMLTTHSSNECGN